VFVRQNGGYGPLIGEGLLIVIAAAFFWCVCSRQMKKGARGLPFVSYYCELSTAKVSTWERRTFFRRGKVVPYKLIV